MQTKSRKVFKSLAHNIAHSFMSCMNSCWGSIDYVSDFIATELIRHKQKVFYFDILEQKINCDFLLKHKEFIEMMQWFKRILPTFFKNVGFDESEKIIKKAIMRIEFDINTKREISSYEYHENINFNAWVLLVDEKGKKYQNTCKRFALFVP